MSPAIFRVKRWEGNARLHLLLIFIAVTSLFVPSVGYAGRCPADRFKASTARIFGNQFPD